jgi:hypothetical protein
MADPNILDFMRIPSEALVALDWRPYHFASQPYHYLVRAAHVVSMAAFFGGVAVIDLRLMGSRATPPLRALSDLMTPWLPLMFWTAIVSGFALFLYDPVHVGSHAYFSLKLLLTLLGFANALVIRRSKSFAALSAEPPALMASPASVRFLGLVALLLWTGVIVCACLNVEAMPKVLLR